MPSKNKKLSESFLKSSATHQDVVDDKLQRKQYRKVLEELSEVTERRKQIYDSTNSVILVNQPYDLEGFSDFLESIRDTRPVNRYPGRQIDYHYYNHISSFQDIYDAVREVKAQYRRGFRMEIVFGSIWEETEYILEDNSSVDKLSYFDRFLIHAANGKFQFIRANGSKSQSIIIRGNNDINNAINQMTPEAIVDNAYVNRENTKVRLIGIYATLITITSLDVRMGSKTKLPDYLKNIRALIGLENIDGNLCFFASIAIYSGCRVDRTITKAKKIFKEFYGYDHTNEYPGFDYQNELDAFEQKFLCPVNVYSINSDLSCDTIRLSALVNNGDPVNSHQRSCDLNLYLNHFSYIRDMTKAIRDYRCKICTMKFKDNYDLNRHMEVCGTEIVSFPNEWERLFHKKGNIIYNLCEYYGYSKEVGSDLAKELLKVKDELYKYVYVIVWDMEAMLKLIVNTSVSVSNTNYLGEHVPECIPIASNIPGYEEQYLFNKDPVKLIKEFFQYLDKATAVASQLMKDQMAPLFNAIKSADEGIRYGVTVLNKKNEEVELEPFSHEEVQFPKIEEYCKGCPIIGFNSGKYDINVLTKYGFVGEILKRSPLVQSKDGSWKREDPFVIKTCNQYKQIKVDNINFLDQMLYCAGGTNLKSFIKSYTGKDQKFVFPHDKNTSYEFLDEPVNSLTVDDFESKLKNKNILNDLRKDDKDKRSLTELFQQFKDECVRLGLWDKKIYDLLEHYATMDVKPLLEACLKQRELFYDFKLEMFKDAMTLPGLSQQVLNKFMFKKFEEMMEMKLGEIENKSMELPEIISVPVELVNVYNLYRQRGQSLFLSQKDLVKRISHYELQDLNKAREPPDLTPANILQILKRDNHKCFYCESELCYDTWTMDRINNNKSHDYDNLVSCCKKCNSSKANKPMMEFYRKKQLEIYSNENEDKLIFLNTNPVVFDLFKSNLIGGPSLVFHRYHEKGVTYINKVRYSKNRGFYYIDERTHLVKKIVGYDANSLYPWGMMQDHLCGKLEYRTAEELAKDGIDWDHVKEQTLNEEFFGCCEVDIEVPKKLWNKFTEFPPLFIHADVNTRNCGEYTDRLINHLGRTNKLYRHKIDSKLISSLKATKVLIMTPLLKWYLEHGLVVTKLHSVIEAQRGKPMKDFIDWGADQRRLGDQEVEVINEKGEKVKCKPNAIKAENAKLEMNSSYGGMEMDKTKHMKVKFCDEVHFNKYKNEYHYAGGEEHMMDDDVVYEVSLHKRMIKQDVAMHIGYGILQYAKLRMLQFYYDFLQKYIDDKSFQLIQMDTDSLYMALSADRIEDIVKPEMIEEFEKDKHNWIPRTKECECCKSNPDIKLHEAYDKRTPGLFKVEKEGDRIIATTCKSYYLDGAKGKKMALKGGQSRNNVQWESFYNSLFNMENIEGENMGFKMNRDETGRRAMNTYTTRKIILSPLYIKRIIFDDGVHTGPLDVDTLFD